MRSIGPAVTREQSPAFLRNSTGRLDLPGPTQEAAWIPRRNSDQLRTSHNSTGTLYSFLPHNKCYCVSAVTMKGTRDTTKLQTGGHRPPVACVQWGRQTAIQQLLRHRQLILNFPIIKWFLKALYLASRRLYISKRTGIWCKQQISE